jgi:hypothetical protein
MATNNWVTQNIPGVIEYLDGDPNAPGYRADHGGSNYHSHYAFKDRETTLKAKALLEKHGVKVTGFGDRSGHAENSYHYSDQAFDVPGAQWGKATDAEVFAGSSKVRKLLLDGLRDQTPGTKAPSTLATTSSPTTTSSAEAPAGPAPKSEPFTPKEAPTWLQNLQAEVLAQVGQSPQFDPIDVGAIIGRPGSMVSGGTPEPRPAAVANPPVRGALDGTRVGSPAQLQIAYGGRANGLGIQAGPGREGLMRANTERRL